MIYDEIDGPDRTSEQRHQPRPVDVSDERALWYARTDPFSVYYDPSWVGTEMPK